MYLMHTSLKNLSFNVEKTNGNNLGHDVHQPCIFKFLHLIKRLPMPPHQGGAGHLAGEGNSSDEDDKNGDGEIPRGVRHLPK